MADTSAIIAPVSTSNVPSILTDQTGLPANAARGGWTIQNLGTNTLYVLLGTGATSTSFHVALKGGSGNDDGSGGSYAQTAGVVYTGVVSVAGTLPRYTLLEMTK